MIFSLSGLKKVNNKWKLVIYDLIVFVIADFLVFYSHNGVGMSTLLQHTLLAAISFFVCRVSMKIYGQIWRYGGIQCYIRMLCSDGLAFLLYLFLYFLLPVNQVPVNRIMGLISMTLLGSLCIRMIYRYAYKCADGNTVKGRFLSRLLAIFGGIDIPCDSDSKKIKVAIVGAGRVGVSLADEFFSNPNSSYVPRLFIDNNPAKAGRAVNGLSVILDDDKLFGHLEDYEIQEVIFAIPALDGEKKKMLYDYYSKSGCRLKIYDYPMVQNAGDRRALREFDVEELLFRKPITISNDYLKDYYKGKTILITGGGGSIGSELCRQVAKFEPGKLILLDIYENGVYDVQQEMNYAYKGKLDLSVEIGSISNERGMERIFEKYHPEIIIHAAAHKHVPLMENNAVEAIENNVFGTEVLIRLAEKYDAERFMMVSTDKAVNPTNVMGATKRMCEMMVQSASKYGHVKYSATRFGNVLGSAGSVIPLFKRQIAKGGPVTITDKRIIRYFMTIPEASQLVLESGAMAENGELFVLDMGSPVKIIDLAENMIRLSGANNIEIIETGLRPGEKLYEELLVKKDNLVRTENEKIFIEKDQPLTQEEISGKLKILQKACLTDDNTYAKCALRNVVPTYRTPEEVNMNMVKGKKKFFTREVVNK